MNQYRYLYREMSNYLQNIYSAKNKKGKDSKNWETQYRNIWIGKKR